MTPPANSRGRHLGGSPPVGIGVAAEMAADSGGGVDTGPGRGVVSIVIVMEGVGDAFAAAISAKSRGSPFPAI